MWTLGFESLPRRLKLILGWKMVGIKQNVKTPKKSKPILGYVLIILLIEKAIQHVIVTISFFYNISDIRSTVAVEYNFLMISGAVVSVLFVVALWGILKKRNWGIILAAALAVFDIIGEFVAQGTIFITIMISILVVIVLLILCPFAYRNLKMSKVGSN